MAGDQQETDPDLIFESSLEPSESKSASGSKSPALSNAETALIQFGVMAMIGWVLLFELKREPFSLYQPVDMAIVIVVAYFLSAFLLLGLNEFIAAFYREYRQFLR